MRTMLATGAMLAAATSAEALARPVTSVAAGSGYFHDRNVADNQIKPGLHLVNPGSTPVTLASVKVR
jgi:hypothetical protein